MVATNINLVCLLFLYVFFTFNDYLFIFRLYLCLEGMRRMEMGSNSENGPKQHVWCHLRLVVFSYYNICS